MKAIIFTIAVLFMVASCGKKAPLRPPEDPEQRAAAIDRVSEQT